MPNYHISNGTIYDGSGDDGFRGDLLVQDGKIAKISREPLDKREGFQHIDAEGLWVMPGFNRLVRRNDDTVPYVLINGRIAWQQGKKAADLGKSTNFGVVLQATNA